MVGLHFNTTLILKNSRILIFKSFWFFVSFDWSSVGWRQVSQVSSISTIFITRTTLQTVNRRRGLQCMGLKMEVFRPLVKLHFSLGTTGNCLLSASRLAFSKYETLIHLSPVIKAYFIRPVNPKSAPSTGVMPRSRAMRYHFYTLSGRKVDI